MIMQGKVIDANGHILEPPDLWTSRAPASMHHRMPQHKVIEGRTAWYVDGAT